MLSFDPRITDLMATSDGFLMIRHGDVPVLTADPTVAERELGFQASHTLDQMCADLWRWQSMNPNGYE
jgi:UDP-glucose 4-epimerase